MRNIFFKTLWWRRRDYAIVLLCETFHTAISFSTYVLTDYLTLILNKKSSDLLNMEVASTVFSLTRCLLFFFMVLILMSYIRKRAGDYAMLESLGIQKKHKYKFIACEYCGIFLVSLTVGLMLGIVLSRLLHDEMLKLFSDTVTTLYYGKTPWIAVLVTELILMISLFIAFDEIIACLGIDALLSLGKQSSKMYRRRPFLTLAGLVLALISFINLGFYWGRGYPTVPILLLLAGIFILMRTFCGEYLSRLKEKKQKYYRNITWLDNWYHRIFYHTNASFLMAAFLFITIFFFSLTLLDHLPLQSPENYPYDIVWFARESDRDFIHSLENEYDMEITEIPCFRACTADAAEQTAISASTYEAWTGKHLDLKENEVHVVYQRSRADLTSLGIDNNSDAPRIFIGCAQPGLWRTIRGQIVPSNLFDKRYPIVSTENRILTGTFEGYKNENIIVFSDEYYNQVHEDTTGANLVVMVHITGDSDEVLNALYAYAESLTPVDDEGILIYDKKQLLLTERTDNLFTTFAAGLNMIILFLCTIFIFIIKTKNDSPELKQKYLFYFQSGMTQKKVKNGILKETALPACLALVFGLASSAIFTAAKLYLKNLDSGWLFRYIRKFLGIYGGIILIYAVSVMILARHCCREIERSNENE